MLNPEELPDYMRPREAPPWLKRMCFQPKTKKCPSQGCISTIPLSEIQCEKCFFKGWLIIGGVSFAAFWLMYVLARVF